MEGPHIHIVPPPARPVADKLLRTSAFLFASTILGGALGYAYQIVMGRFLSPEDYGLFMALMALIPILSVPISTVYMSVSRRFSRYLALEQKDAFDDFFWSAQLKMLAFGVLGLLVFLALSAPLTNFLSAPSLVPVWLVGIYMFFILLTPIVNAAIQASQKFRFIAVTNVVGPLAKLVSGAAFIAIGWRVEGALCGLVATAAFLAAFGFHYCRRRLDLRWRRPSWSHRLGIGEVYPVLLATLAFTLLFQVDLLLVKHLFSPHVAGMYAAAATLGKAVLFLPTSIVVPLFPMTAAAAATGQNTTRLLRKAIGATLVLTLAGALVYFIFAEMIVLLLFGEKYREAIPILRYYGFAMVPIAIVMVVEHYLVAKGRMLFAYLIFACSPVFIGSALYWRGDPLNIVWLMIAVGIAILAVALLIWGRTGVDQNPNRVG